MQTCGFNFPYELTSTMTSPLLSYSFDFAFFFNVSTDAQVPISLIFHSTFVPFDVPTNSSPSNDPPMMFLLLLLP